MFTPGYLYRRRSAHVFPRGVGTIYARANKPTPKIYLAKFSLSNPSHINPIYDVSLALMAVRSQGRHKYMSDTFAPDDILCFLPTKFIISCRVSGLAQPAPLLHVLLKTWAYPYFIKGHISQTILLRPERKWKLRRCAPPPIAWNLRARFPPVPPPIPFPSGKKKVGKFSFWCDHALAFILRRVLLLSSARIGPFWGTPSRKLTTLSRES